MKKEDLFDALCDIDSNYVKDAHRKNKRKNNVWWVKWGTIAACFVVLVLCSSVVKRYHVPPIVPPVEPSTTEPSAPEPSTTEPSSTGHSNESETSSEPSFATSETEPHTEESPVGGGDYTFLRKYIDEVYNIQLASEVVGREACDEWVNNVFQKKSAEEQEGIPPIYQIIVELEIPKEELIKKNNELDGIYLSAATIEALYLEDIEEVKKALMSPFALYYEGEIYTYDEFAESRVEADIPAETLDEYFDYIQEICVQEGIIKYMWESIDNTRRAYGLEGIIVDFN